MTRLSHTRLSRAFLIAMLPVFAGAAGLGWLLTPELAAAPTFCPNWAPRDAPVWQEAQGSGVGASCGAACSAAQADAFSSVGCSVCYHEATCGCACEIGGGCSAVFSMTYVCWVVW